MKEIWKEIENTEGRYQVSNLGRIKTFNWKNTGREQIMKPAADHKGYLRTALVMGAEKKLTTVKVHRVVAQAFLLNPDNLSQVNHKNGDKSNNSVSNLEWMDNLDNIQHAINTGLFGNSFQALTDSNNRRKRPIEATEIKTGNILRFESCSEARRVTGSSKIQLVIQGKRHQSNGFVFRYAEMGVV